MWKLIASVILRNRTPILISLVCFVLILVATTLHFGVKFTTSNAELLPADDPISINFKKFKEIFGNEDSMVVIGYEDEAMGQAQNLKRWQNLLSEMGEIEGVDGIFSMAAAQKLTRDSTGNGFVMRPIMSESERDSWVAMRSKIQQFPFYESVLYNKTNEATQAVVYLKSEIVDSKKRIDVSLKINDLVDGFSQKTGIKTYLSGMPIIRTMNAKQIKGETIGFILASLGVTCFIFFIFFRSFRATAVAISVVICAVALCFAMMSVFGFEITLLTALVPPLLIVIGIPNCIYLINKYQSEYKIHNNKIKALQRMIMHVGNAALLTNFTTAFGFLTFIFTDSSSLREFGVIASLNIVGIFIFSFLIIPTAYSFFKPPKDKHLKHHNRNWTSRVLETMEHWVINHRPWVYRTTGLLAIISIVGIFKMEKSGNLLDDMSKDAKFYKDISFFDQEFGGILPLEIVVNTQQPNGVTSLRNLKKMDDLSLYIDTLGQSSQTMSVVNLVKFAKQAYYGGDSAYYSLPTNQERPFILKEIKASKGDGNLLKNYVDSTLSQARMTTLLRNMDSKDMEHTIVQIQERLQQLFPEKNYQAYVSGMAYLFMKGTSYLTYNLMISLSLAVFMIALFMALMFRSYQMILISLIPNFLPLLLTAGLMGYLNIPIKPSTILVFSIAFGIAVDDTIHFLAKYRQDLKHFNGDITKSVAKAMEEVGNSMFYTSVVLFAGFAVFMFSGFSGIVALGGLVSFTLLSAMLSNLILLPSLLLTYERLSDKDFIDPDVDLFDDEDDEV